MTDKARTMETSSTTELESQTKAQRASHSMRSSPETESTRRRVPLLRRIREYRPRPQLVKDAVIGVADGIVVPFAVAAGLTSFGNAKLVVSGGMAELFAGAISMGLGGLLGSQSDGLEYKRTHQETLAMILNEPDKTATIVHDVHANFYPPALVQLLVTEFETFSQDKKLDFLMLHHHHASEPSGKQPFISAGTLSSGYFLGGFLPLIPYFCVKPRRVMLALWCSIAVVAVALFAFGWTKTCSVVGWRGNQKRGAIGALQMVGLGVVATGMAVGIVKGINHGGGAGF